MRTRARQGPHGEPDLDHSPQHGLPACPHRRFFWSAQLLGFSLGGFFDGILLHQVLQWHHLLSAVSGSAVQELQVQLLADGLFHLLMYVIAVIALAVLWTTPRQPVAPTARFLLGNAMIGFGIWHVLDAVVSHWLLGIHRIRMDSAHPLLWDLGWVLVFGVLVLAAGLALRRPRRPASGPRGAITASLLLSASVVLGGYRAALPPEDLSTFLVVMRPGADAGELIDGLARLGGGILWADRTGSMWAVKLASSGDGARLYRHGAMLVTASPAALGCAAWTIAAPPG